MIAKVDPDMCTACELCVQTCPEVFKMEENTAVAYVSPVPEKFEDAARQAAEECPVEAILIE